MPPRRGRGTLPRPRIEQLIDLVAEASLTVLKAPPGFGKSTLASTWAEAALARGARVAWLTLDDADSTPERLLLYVTAAIQRGFDGERDQSSLKDLALLTAEHLRILLLNDLERRSESCFLFIDDYHRVSPEVLTTAFDQLIRFAPDNLHLVFCGRSDLPPSLFIHLYNEACLEVDASQLRFNLDETRDLLLRTGPQDMSATELLELHKSTDGWIAALRASLLSLRHRPSGGAHLPKSITGLFDELLNRLPKTLSEQLPRLAAVDKFNAELAGRLTRRPDGNALIDELESMQLFLNELDDNGEWFSFHPLFREHLVRRLPQTELLSSLRVTAHWFAAQQLWADAIRSALLASDSDSAQQWIAHCAMDMVEQGDFIILLDWQQQLQHHLLQSPPQLKLALAWASGLAMTRNNSLRLLSEVETELATFGQLDEQHDLYWECQALQAMLLALDDDDEAGSTLAKRCLPNLNSRPWISNTLLNVEAFGHLAASRWEDFYSLPPVIHEPLEHNRYLFNQIYRYCLAGLAESRQGRLSQATIILEEALRLTATAAIGPSPAHPILCALPASLLAGVRYLQGRLDEAYRLSLESLELAKIGGFLDSLATVFITASRLSSRNTNSQSARHLLEEGERLARTRQWPRLQAQMLLERTRVSLLENKSHEALACVRQLDCLLASQPQEVAGRLNDYQVATSLAELWCEAAGLPRLADLQRAETLRQLAVQCNQQLVQTLLSASLALTAWQRQQPDLAVQHLQETCALVEHSGAISLISDLPASNCWQQLTTYALQLSSLGKSMQAKLQNLLPNTASVSPTPNGTNLTGKERQVLDLVAQGKSNKEMAKLLGVTPETIKSHMKNIFSKLQVDSRAQAAVAAKTRGLI